MLQHTQAQMWLAVQARDTSLDGQFVFAVVTTGIFCRPGCRARLPLPENVRFFPDVAAAIEAGFRPCKRCRPAGNTPEQQRINRVAQACRMMAQSPEPLTLDALARAVAVSPYHFHRMFKAITGLTPAAWQRALRAGRLRAGLLEGQGITDAALAAGFNSLTTFYRQREDALGMSSKDYRHKGQSQTLCWATGHSELGECLVAESERGICAVLLGDDEASLVAELAARFPAAHCVKDEARLNVHLQRVLELIARPGQSVDLPLDLQGTAFQLQVWQALRAIPAGQTLSYQALAARLGKPAAIRAVASACGANKLAIIIPCHRIIRGNGELAGYRWGIHRKAALLDREARCAENIINVEEHEPVQR